MSHLTEKPAPESEAATRRGTRTESKADAVGDSPARDASREPATVARVSFLDTLMRTLSAPHV